MWGVLLMCEAACQKFGGLFALRLLSGAFEAIADPAFMFIITTYYTREEQPWRISAYYLWNGLGVAGGGLIGYGIGHIEGALASWRYEFLIIGAVCSFWAIILALLLPNSPATFWGFSREERLLMVARVRKNQTGVEQKKVNWSQIKEAYLDYKVWLFTLLGFFANIPNGGISNFSTLVIQGLGFDTFHTALLGIPQGMSTKPVSYTSSAGTLTRCDHRYLDCGRGDCGTVHAQELADLCLRPLHASHDCWGSWVSPRAGRRLRGPTDLLVRLVSYFPSCLYRR